LKFERLQNRGLVRVNGEDSEHFLENLITCEVVNMKEGDTRFGALLTPQGKILYDFFLFRENGAYCFDINASLVAEFSKRLMFYRLRAKVDIVVLETIDVTACWGDDTPTGLNSHQDARHPEMGYRIYGETGDNMTSGDYALHRISLNVPQGGIDFEYGDAYPHETLMDQFGGVDFRKGCYVGQEVVSRMQHRGSAKKRIVQITASEPLPHSGTPITANGKPAGIVGSVAGNQGLALLRLDRVAKADQLLAGDTIISAEIPDWVNFSWPEVN